MWCGESNWWIVSYMYFWGIVTLRLSNLLQHFVLNQDFLELEGKEAKKCPSTERKVVVTNRRKMESSTLTPEISSIKSEKKSDLGHKDRPKLPKMIVHYDYFDDGSHWCRSCNSIFTTIDELCLHLHSSKHCEVILEITNGLEFLKLNYCSV